MARALDEEQQAELTAFVNELASAAGYTTTAEWSRESGYPASNLSNLRNGRGAIDGFNLLRLIRAAAARANREPREMATALTAGDEARLARRLDEMGAGMTELARLLRESLGEPAAGESPALQPRTSTEEPAAEETAP